MQQSLTAYRSYQKLIEDCDREIRRALEQFHPPDPPPASATDIAPASPPTNTRSSDGVLRAELKRAFGIDLTQIPGIRTGIAQALFGEIGPDFTKFRSASAFASWMGLCPDNEISGGKVLWVGTRKVNCRAATALRMAAQSLHHSKSALGDFGACELSWALLKPSLRLLTNWPASFSTWSQPTKNSTPVTSPLINSVFRNARKLNSVPKRELSDSNLSPWNRPHE